MAMLNESRRKECRKFCCTGHHPEEEEEEEREPPYTWKKYIKSIMDGRGLEDGGWVNILLWELKNAIA
jgi:hypothetical protein